MMTMHTEATIEGVMAGYSRTAGIFVSLDCGNSRTVITPVAARLLAEALWSYAELRERG